MSNRISVYAIKTQEQIAELHKPLSPISRLSDQQLQNLEDNYRRAKKIRGGRWSLDEVLQEKQRRIADERDPYSVLKVIVQACRRAPDCRMTYVQLWRAIRPGQPWINYSPMNAVMSAMQRVIHYCIIHDLPIITSLVVPANGQLSDKAVGNIFKACAGLGRVPAHLSPDRFVMQQIVSSRAFVNAVK